ncbi:MAG: hypothetical protein H6R02_592 [Burkholderiaceae bacterium]|jgi:hypothetical protein|nr:hypothetical protein [Burkholderiaceae bacterium]
MQDWLAAMTMMKSMPTPLYVASAPVVSTAMRRVAVRHGPVPVKRVTVAAPVVQVDSAARVAGARALYWVTLAVAVAVLAFQ